MLTPQDIASIFGVTIEVAQAHLSAIDQAEIIRNERSSISIEKWDKTSPINGIAAEEWLRRDDVNQDSAIYLLRDGSRLFFQPHAPGVPGFQWMTDDNIMGIANAHADEIASEIADGKVVSALASVIGTPVGPVV